MKRETQEEIGLADAKYIDIEEIKDSTHLLEKLIVETVTNTCNL